MVEVKVILHLGGTKKNPKKLEEVRGFSTVAGFRQVVRVGGFLDTLWVFVYTCFFHDCIHSALPVLESSYKNKTLPFSFRLTIALELWSGREISMTQFELLL